MPNPPNKFVRLYLVEGRFPDSAPNAPDPDPPTLTLKLVGRFPTHGKASQFLHSKECFHRYLRDQGRIEADFLVVSENNHFRIAPVTVTLPRPLSTPPTDSLTARLT
jgi:hypothetical protein